ncbi:hypothetical protein TSOC_003488 [Tetrabaena socialis]|uniref:Uncharacterized protein n=1 Tax=Tetrabaena socialis TaxID=47790 RepID=A0A2J8ABD6_9CHLO|nr:hypothetical protein TSOC_003488 [Tetrabaena socialis]|eukprot:PNH09839.1 hypothetical protein TSOC_003488 [Tetrabaena socialis]
MLRATIRLAEHHLLPSTPYNLYVFTRRNALQRLRNGLADLQRPHLFVLPVTNESWVLPGAARDRSTWHGWVGEGIWGASYRLMGDWRLGFMPRFARERGHRYVLQLDDNSYITGAVGQDLVALFDREAYHIGVQRMAVDPPLVAWGLPELARYFLLVYQLQPKSLFQHCDPASMAGLYSATETEGGNSDLAPAQKLFDVPTHGGWDRTVLSGNCVMISLDFWFQPLVQAFVELCRASGGAVQYRWNEQGVLGMLAQIFVEEGRLLNFTFLFMHRVSAAEALLASGLSPDPSV